MFLKAYLFTAILFTRYVISGFQQQITRHTKTAKTQLEGTERVSKPESDVAGMLELTDWQEKGTMINTLRALMEKRDNRQAQMGNVSRDGEAKKRLKRKC